MEKEKKKYTLSNDIDWYSKVEEVYQTFMKKKKLQHNIPSYYDIRLLKALVKLLSLDKNQLLKEQFHLPEIKPAAEIANTYFINYSGPRFVPFSDRSHPPDKSSKFFFEYSLIHGQGINHSMHWKGMQLIKGVYDYSLYPILLWNEQPKTIIEIGSGNGASAIWMADLMKSYELKTKVISLDIIEVQHNRADITFIKDDAENIPTLFPKEQLEKLEHPWLIVHDEHFHIDLALSHFSQYMEKGDYFFIEDSRKFQGVIGNFLTQSDNTLLVDTMYTDYFGRNTTSAENSILRKC